ncbi:aspartate/glutamate racemase family protein [Oceanispirochaeta sp.]|jgi:aspartate racemase|uniref:aspartate/glutamate racemase family protein n=1 Tax=Oceanispirochaeta sp. TaxID=2035350 RepID=UPI0026095F03|nr:aspartate/glutamate racemase family protein [Oceanispirochaeta sp.]MDA3955801.1 aspartate/glutamate racemase family protein [Oceanispirochaeta sp.]
MKKIGLLGGMSWESTQDYYRIINEGIKERLGGLHSAEIILYSVDFDPIEKLQQEGDWSGTESILIKAARSIEKAGADFLLICTNTMHKVAPEIEKALSIPLLHIADATAEALIQDGVSCVGLLGTAFTMEQKFYKRRLEEKFGLVVLIPGDNDRKTVHRVIYEELCLGNIRKDSAEDFYRIMGKLAEKGAEAVILGCTEIGQLVQQSNTKIRLYDTTGIHARQAVEYALED